MPATPKRIALFLDGTWNTVENNTNVWRLKSLCDNDGDAQIVYYSAGVGTEQGQRLWGGMFGFGLIDEVIRAYEWLVEHYAPGDRVYLFGFSRGAFTARALSGLISKCGLLEPGSPISVRQLFARYQRTAAPTIRALAAAKAVELTLEERWILKYSQPIAIGFVGVWDTVGALGVPFGHLPLVSRSTFQFLETDLRISNDTAFHALAIDEHRRAFAPTLWTRTVPKASAAAEGLPPPRPVGQVEQRWFVGAHANVGGGYPSDLLAQVPLRWLMEKAASQGMTFKRTVSLDGDVSLAPIVDSYGQMFWGLYRLATLNRPYFRPIGQGPVDLGDAVRTTINETLDGSVFERWRQDPGYRPRNLLTWADARGVNPAQLEGAVFADGAGAVPAEPAATGPGVR